MRVVCVVCVRGAAGIGVSVRWMDGMYGYMRCDAMSDAVRYNAMLSGGVDAGCCLRYC